MIFDFSDRYQAAFGFVAGNVSRFLANESLATILTSKNIKKMPVYVWDKNTSFDEVTLSRGNNGTEEQYLFGFRSLADEYSEIFATPPMLSLKRAKRLVITPIDNSDIEVVERYSTEPWEITWRGLLVDMINHEFPLEKMEQLNKIFEVNEIWNVHSEILQAVGVEAIYIKDIQIDFVEGYEDTISYNFTARAIKPLEYQLINNQ